MKFVFNFFFFLILVSNSYSDNIYTKTLKDAAIRNGFDKPENINNSFDNKKAELGEIFFKEKMLSFNSKNSCSTCHLDKFSSADGLPNAVGTRGDREGNLRIFSEGDIVPRNTLPLWGRGGKDFNVFFWDGKVEKKGNEIISQLGLFKKNYVSSDGTYKISVKDDALITAIHLPFVEIRELVTDDEEVEKHLKTEKIDAAFNIYSQIINRVKEHPEYSKKLSEAYSLTVENLEFFHIADSISHFIKKKFAIKNTKFSDFVFNNKDLNKEEIKGGLLFYGKGKCSTCHSGKHFSDFSFYSIPFPQLGFGKNGFGIDYGKYNTTFDVNDIYKFRTPPLYNVEKTAPYSHSGSIYKLDETIVYHFDPLRYFKSENFSEIDRVEFYKKIVSSKKSMNQIPYLDNDEVKSLVVFLKTLTFD